MASRSWLVAIEMGSLGVWVGGIATFSAALIALLGSLGRFERVRAPRLELTFDQAEPWCRTDADGVVWLRVALRNVGHRPARGCVGRLTAVSTDGRARHDIDPVRLRWAGVPRAWSFELVDVRRGQREFLNVLCLCPGRDWRIVTFDEPDFNPGFSTELAAGLRHRLQVSVFADDAETVSRAIDIAPLEPDGSVLARLLENR
jgi:hypothetical protein